MVRHEIWNYLLSLKKGGISAVISTNHLEEAERLCDRAVLIFDGMIVADGTIEELKNYGINDHFLTISLKHKEIDRLRHIADHLLEKEGSRIKDIVITSDGLKVICNNESHLALPLIVKCLTEFNVHISAVATGEKSLEAAMLHISSDNAAKQNIPDRCLQAR
jgi:ABC-type multidrug transport system ATPase subunit